MSDLNCTDLNRPTLALAVNKAGHPADGLCASLIRLNPHRPWVPTKGMSSHTMDLGVYAKSSPFSSMKSAVMWDQQRYVCSENTVGRYVYWPDNLNSKLYIFLIPTSFKKDSHSKPLSLSKLWSLCIHWRMIARGLLRFCEMWFIQKLKTVYSSRWFVVVGYQMALKNIRLNPAFRQACRPDVQNHCSQHNRKYVVIVIKRFFIKTLRMCNSSSQERPPPS